MNQQGFVNEIRDINLNYLVLAQQMIRDDKPTALARLGLSDALASLIGDLSTAQLISLASNHAMLTRFRFDDASILGLVSTEHRDQRLSRVHASLVLASQPVAEIQ